MWPWIISHTGLPIPNPILDPPPWFQPFKYLPCSANYCLCLSLSPAACGLYPALPGPREEEEETEEEEEEDAHQFCCPASECSSPSSR